MAYSFLPVGVVVTTGVVLAAVVNDDLALWQRPLVGVGGALAGGRLDVLRPASRPHRVSMSIVKECVRRFVKTMRFRHAEVPGFSVEPWRDPLGRVVRAVAVNLTSGHKIVIPELCRGSPAVFGGTPHSEIVSRLTDAQRQHG